MANISIINLAGTDLSLKSLAINGKYISSESKIINMLGSVEFDYRDVDWQKFNDFIMEVERGGVIYRVDLNRDHYFSGSDYRYPGSGSKVRYILSGLSTDGKSIQFNTAYNSPDLPKYKYSSDLKYLSAL